jgi:hypothetical protein
MPKPLGVGTTRGSDSRASTKTSTLIIVSKHGVKILQLFATFTLGMLVQNYFHALNDLEPLLQQQELPHPSFHSSRGGGRVASKTTRTTTSSFSSKLPPAFSGLANRALLHQQHCQAITGVMMPPPAAADHHNTQNNGGKINNNHTAHLSQFGILDAIRKYQQPPPPQNNNKNDDDDYPYTCQLPPEHECGETQFTVIFMAYNPERLQKLYNQIHKMLTDTEFAPLVAEIVVVWNGDRQVEETKLGRTLVELVTTTKQRVRISYPLQAGFPNDLMNRYHPRLDIQTKAIMYYDDDGPFYSYKATLGGFELWKRNANAQIGAMARKLDLGPRQRDEQQALLNGPGDRFFVSHCTTTNNDHNNPNFINDDIRYNFNEFANFGANMVLPSGSFLHSNYLCFLWHPLFAEIRQYVQDHPVNPDDGTVSMIVAQLGGRAPKVYSRRINESKQRRRLLQQPPSPSPPPQERNETTTSTNSTTSTMEEEEVLFHRHRRRLMDGIDWDHGGGHDKKHNWGQLRSDVANSLARYFGSMNSGSIGWCYGTPYQSGQYCKPEFAKVGYLPWMKEDHMPRDVCP